MGKSSLINSLLKRAALPIYSLTSSSRGPSTTEGPQEVALEVDSQKIVLIDTPGLSFVCNEDADQSTLEEIRARDILLRNKGRIDRLKDPHPPGVFKSGALLIYCLSILTIFSCQWEQSLILFLGLTLKISCFYTIYRPFQKETAPLSSPE